MSIVTGHDPFAAGRKCMECGQPFFRMQRIWQWDFGEAGFSGIAIHDTCLMRFLPGMLMDFGHLMREDAEGPRHQRRIAEMDAHAEADREWRKPLSLDPIYLAEDPEVH